MGQTSIAQRKEALYILSLTERERMLNRLPMTYVAIADKFKVSVNTVLKWEAQVPGYLQEEANSRREILGVVGDIAKTDKELKKIDTAQYLKGRNAEINEALIQACKNGNATALRLYFQMTEQIDKEDSIGITGDEIAKQHIENRRWLKEHGYLEEAGVG